MMRYALPTALIIAAIGLFIFYTDPAYQAAQAMAAQNTSYDDALNKSAQLHAMRDQLLAKRNSFSADDITKLEYVLPDNVDTIRLIIDVNSIAARHNLSLTNVQLGSLGGGVSASPGAVGTGSGPVGNVDVGFSITTDYPTFLAFMQDLEHSQRLLDIDKLSFSAPASGSQTSYAFSIRTYWLH
jgi:Tfp pilus assembly protein PilO